MVKQERPEVPVMFVRAVGGPAGSAAAFERLERPLPTLRGRKFFATCRGQDYRACVELRHDDDPEALGLEVGAIPGGLYAKQRLAGGPEKIAAAFDAMATEHAQDASRPCVEFYRRHDEEILFLPITG
jgi:DNA gyrase inhibitor GyrI